MNRGDEQTDWRQQRNNTWLSPPEGMHKEQEVSQIAQKFFRGENFGTKLKEKFSPRNDPCHCRSKLHSSFLVDTDVVMQHALLRILMADVPQLGGEWGAMDAQRALHSHWVLISGHWNEDRRQGRSRHPPTHSLAAPHDPPGSPPSDLQPLTIDLQSRRLQTTHSRSLPSSPFPLGF